MVNLILIMETYQTKIVTMEIGAMMGMIEKDVISIPASVVEDISTIQTSKVFW